MTVVVGSERLVTGRETRGSEPPNSTPALWHGATRFRLTSIAFRSNFRCSNRRSVDNGAKAVGRCSARNLLVSKLPRLVRMRSPTKVGSLVIAAGVALVGLTMAHIYFAIRPEKLWLTKSMLFGFITRRQYLEHHDPTRWRVPGS